MISFFSGIGAAVLKTLSETGKVSILLANTLVESKNVFKDRKLFFAQAYEIGFSSLLLIISIAFFTGAVTAYQMAAQMVKLVPLTFLGLSVHKMMTMELGPVLTGIIMSGRYGSSIAAELGTMKVTEQIDALKAMAINPIRYLAVPRITASFIMLPIVVIFANLIGIFGGFLIANMFFDLGLAAYFNEVRNHFDLADIFMGVIKAFVFGGIFSLIGCYVGFNTTGGAEGVGKATVRAFVISSVLILISDLIVAMTYM